MEGNFWSSFRCGNREPAGRAVITVAFVVTLEEFGGLGK